MGTNCPIDFLKMGFLCFCLKTDACKFQEDRYSMLNFLLLILMIMLCPGNNTLRGSIIVRLTLFCLDSDALLMFN